MMKMVAGFLFRDDTVLLVHKEKPDWQRGLMNGVGGKMNADETPIAAMEREFREETSYQGLLNWRHFATEMASPEAMVYFFRADWDYAAEPYWWPTHNDVDELLMWIHSEDLRPMRRIGNLSWLIPLAKDPRDVKPILVEPQKNIRERATW